MTKPTPSRAPIVETVHDGLKVGSSVRAVAYAAGKSRKKGRRWEIWSGDVISRALGRLVKKDRLIDPEADFYRETVVDPATGDALHHDEGRLSDHQGRGSAKKR